MLFCTTTTSILVNSPRNNYFTVVECLLFPTSSSSTTTLSSAHQRNIDNAAINTETPQQRILTASPRIQEQEQRQSRPQQRLQQNQRQQQQQLPPAKLLLRQIRSQKKLIQKQSTTTSPSPSPSTSPNSLTTFVVDILSQLMPTKIDGSTGFLTYKNSVMNVTSTTTNASTTCPQKDEVLHLPLLDGSYSTVIVEALSIFGKSNRSDLVLEWYNRWNDYHDYFHLFGGGGGGNGNGDGDGVIGVVPTYYEKNENVRSMAISALGYCGRHVDAVRLLLPPPPTTTTTTNSTTTTTTTPVSSSKATGARKNSNKEGSISTMVTATAGSYNAAIAACKDAQDWELALEVFETIMPPGLISTITVNAVMSVLLASRQGLVALDLLERFWKPPTAKSSLVDGVTFQLVTSALIRSGEIDHAYSLLGKLSKYADKEERQILKINSIEPICDLLASAYERQSNWEAIRHVEELRTSMYDTRLEQHQPQQQYHSFQHWDNLEKVKKESYWVVGTYRPLNITVGLHPNRNPAKNGIQLVFYSNEQPSGDDDSRWDRTKIGYLLMQNSITVEKANGYDVMNGKSSLLGMFLEPSQRGKGLAKICFALWIWFCLKGGIEPCTGIIRKPLISLTLQKSFGFVPLGDGGVDVELSPDPSDPTMTVLYCPSGKCLEGAFSPWELEKQGIRLASCPPVTRGKIVRVGCALSPPQDKDFLRRAVQKYVGTDDDDCIEGTSEQSTWECEIAMTRNEIRRLFLGI